MATRHGCLGQAAAAGRRKTHQDDGAEVELDVSLWPSLKAATLAQFHANVKKLTSLVVRAAKLAVSPDVYVPRPRRLGASLR